MCTIILNRIISSFNETTDAGAQLYNELKAQICSDNKAVVDMAGVTSLSSVFLNVSIGKIIDEYGMKRLKEFVSFINITQQQAKRLKEYLERYSSTEA